MHAELQFYGLFSHTVPVSGHDTVSLYVLFYQIRAEMYPGTGEGRISGPSGFQGKWTFEVKTQDVITA